MLWRNKSLPQLIGTLLSHGAKLCFLIAFWPIFDWNGTYFSLRMSLQGYLVLLLATLFLALVTVIEKPNVGLTVFVIVCDAIFLYGLIASLFVEDNATPLFICTMFSIMAVLIVLSRPKTAHYMRDKYYESARIAEKKEIT